MDLRGVRRFASWCLAHLALLAGAALYLAGLFISAAGFAMPWLRLALGSAAIGCTAGALALGGRWVWPVLTAALPRAGGGDVETLAGRFFGLLGLLFGGILAGAGALASVPDVGALGLGLAVGGFLLVTLSEPQSGGPRARTGPGPPGSESSARSS